MKSERDKSVTNKYKDMVDAETELRVILGAPQGKFNLLLVVTLFKIEYSYPVACP